MAMKMNRPTHRADCIWVIESETASDQSLAEVGDIQPTSQVTQAHQIHKTIQGSYSGTGLLYTTPSPPGHTGDSLTPGRRWGPGVRVRGESAGFHTEGGGETGIPPPPQEFVKL